MPWILIVGVRWISLTSLYYYTMHWPEMCEVKLDENKGFDPKRKGWMKQTMDLQAAKNRLRTRLEWKQHQCKFRTRGKQHQWSLKYKVSGSKQIMWLTQSTYFPGKMFQHKFNHTLEIGGKQQKIALSQCFPSASSCLRGCEECNEAASQEPRSTQHERPREGPVEFFGAAMIFHPQK